MPMPTDCKYSHYFNREQYIDNQCKWIICFLVISGHLQCKDSLACIQSFSIPQGSRGHHGEILCSQLLRPQLERSAGRPGCAQGLDAGEVASLTSPLRSSQRRHPLHHTQLVPGALLRRRSVPGSYTLSLSCYLLIVLCPVSLMTFRSWFVYTFIVLLLVYRAVPWLTSSTPFTHCSQATPAVPMDQQHSSCVAVPHTSCAAGLTNTLAGLTNTVITTVLYNFYIPFQLHRHVSKPSTARLPIFPCYTHSMPHLHIHASILPYYSLHTIVFKIIK